MLLGAVAALYSGVVPPMVQDWLQDENYSHGILVPLISGYVLWTRRVALAEAAREGDSSLWSGLALCVGSLGLLIVGRAGAELFLQRFSLVTLLWGGVWWLWGWGTVRVAAFPLGFLLFMVPLPYLVYDAVAFPLKLFAARIATESLFYLGVPVFREGNIIHLASQTLEVADACSGIRSLLSLLALGVVYAYFTETVQWKRGLIVLSTVPIAIAANAFRVAGTGVLTHYVSPQAAEGFFHTFSGWLVFVVAFVLLFLVGGALRFVGARKR
ncbi:MAG: exosortase [Deferrisomatales bacterium]|nr:exosortase [Deferrisomatales bacterium]